MDASTTLFGNNNATPNVDSDMQKTKDKQKSTEQKPQRQRSILSRVGLYFPVSKIQTSIKEKTWKRVEGAVPVSIAIAVQTTASQWLNETINNVERSGRTMITADDLIATINANSKFIVPFGSQKLISSYSKYSTTYSPPSSIYDVRVTRKRKTPSNPKKTSTKKEGDDNSAVSSSPSVPKSAGESKSTSSSPKQTRIKLKAKSDSSDKDKKDDTSMDEDKTTTSTQPTSKKQSLVRANSDHTEKPAKGNKSAQNKKPTSTTSGTIEEPHLQKSLKQETASYSTKKKHSNHGKNKNGETSTTVDNADDGNAEDDYESVSISRKHKHAKPKTSDAHSIVTTIEKQSFDDIMNILNKDDQNSQLLTQNLLPNPISEEKRKKSTKSESTEKKGNVDVAIAPRKKSEQKKKHNRSDEEELDDGYDKSEIDQHIFSN